MRVMSTPRHMHALSGFGLEIVEYVQSGQSDREEV
jgi:GTP cyclohydrolase II